MDKRFVLLSAILFIFTLILIRKVTQTNITGLVISNIQLSISEKLRGRITLSYSNIVNLTEPQKILVEFTNTGSVTLTEKIEVTIYNYSNSKLQPMAHYYDSQAILLPGMTRSYEAVFIAPETGIYYIRARGSYNSKLGSKVEETWGAFIVVYFSPPTSKPSPAPVSPFVGPVSMPSPAGPSFVGSMPSPTEVGISKMSLEYQDRVEIRQNSSITINILVKNVGSRVLKNLNLYTSTTSLLNVDVSPKQIFAIAPNESALFLLSIEAPANTPTDLYKVDFDIIGDETSESGSIAVNVTQLVSLKELVNKEIQKYEYLIKEVEQQIYDAKAKGLKVDLAQKSLEKARQEFYSAKSYFDLERYEDVMKALKDTEENLKDAVFQLTIASISVTLVRVPAYRPIAILILSIALGLAFFFVLLLRKKKKEKEKRPRLLKELEVER